jgi:hypothetical protein
MWRGAFWFDGKWKSENGKSEIGGGRSKGARE